jgi:hypothetical protein
MTITHLNGASALNAIIILIIYQCQYSGHSAGYTALKPVKKTLMVHLFFCG